MYPLLPSPDRIDNELEELCWEVAKQSQLLGRSLPPSILTAISDFFRIINSYYTNAMEGNKSRLKDIESALKKDFSKDLTLRNFQLEHVAHIETQKEMREQLNKNKDRSICSVEFISWLHKMFYARLPEDLRYAQTERGQRINVAPGEIRSSGVSVGTHHAPEAQADILNYLKTFKEFLEPSTLDKKTQLLGFASSHHRLLWIHPFSDGNGRVARLFTDAYAQKIGVHSEHLWSVTRYFARNRGDYDNHLAIADRPRRNDLDGRGPLSEEDLVLFCKFFLKGCLDQIAYMDKALSPALFLKQRAPQFVRSMVIQNKISKSEGLALEKIFLIGEIPRGEIQNICRVKSRQASKIIKNLFDIGLIESSSKYGPLKLKITSEMAKDLFPDLA